MLKLWPVFLQLYVSDAKTLGMLVVESTLPGSPAHGVLETGDVLVRMNGSIVTHFQQMAEILDDAVAVGAVVVLELERLGVMVSALALGKLSCQHDCHHLSLSQG